MARDANDDEPVTEVSVEVDVSSIADTASSGGHKRLEPARLPADSEPRTLEPQLLVRGLALPPVLLPADDEISVVTVERPELPPLDDDEDDKTSKSIESRLFDVYAPRSSRSGRDDAAALDDASIEITHTPSTLASATGVRTVGARLGTDPDLSEPTAKRAPILARPADEDDDETVTDAMHGFDLAALGEEDEEEERTEKKSARLLRASPVARDDGGTVKMLLDPATARALARAEAMAPAAGAPARPSASPLTTTLLSPEQTVPVPTLPKMAHKQTVPQPAAVRPVPPNLQVTASLPMQPPPPPAPAMAAAAPAVVPPPQASTARATRYEPAALPAPKKSGGRAFAILFFLLVAGAAVALAYRLRPRAFSLPASTPNTPSASAAPTSPTSSASPSPSAATPSSAGAPTSPVAGSSSSSSSSDAEDAAAPSGSASGRGKGRPPPRTAPGPKRP